MKTFRTIFFKELLDTVRDRRTLFVMVIFPLLLFPLLLTAVTAVQTSQIRKAEDRVLRVGLVLHGNAAGLRTLLASRTGYALVEGINPDSARAFLERDSLDAAIVASDRFDRTVAEGGKGIVTLFYRFSDDYSIAERRVKETLREFERGLVEKRFERLDVRPEIVEAVALQEQDITPLKEKLGRTIGGFLPYLFVIFCFMGCMYPAIDLAAGEKERGTIETLLTAPVSRFQILLGKFAVVVLTGLLSAAVSMLGLYVAVSRNPDMPREMLGAITGILDVGTVLLVLSLLLPVAMFFAAFLLSLSFYARSYKEAQSLISPLTIVIILPVAVGMIPGIELTPLTALIPVLNVSLATKEIIAGTITPDLLTLVYASLLALAGISLWACSRWVDREETIFRGG
ncbi:MAG: transporter permease [candidate division NC10 bacterium]|nr:transporter permease [candidate division NC10 bacterium]